MIQSDSEYHAFMTVKAWLLEHGFQLNNREWTSLIWLGILALYSLSRSQVRDSLRKLIRSAMAPKLLIVWLSFITWIALIVIFAQWQRLWDPRLTKDTVVWGATAGVMSLAGFTNAHKPGFFRSAVWKAAGIAVFLEYLVSIKVFPLLVEMLLQPLILVFVSAPSLINVPEEQQKWQAWSSRFFLVLTFALLGNTALSLASDWDLIDWRLLSLRAVWPVGLGFWVLPLVFVLSLISSYEQAFFRLELAQADTKVRWKAKIGLILGLGPNLEWIHHAAKGGTYQIANAKSVWEAWQTSRGFKHERLAKKKAEQSYQEGLIRFANNPGLDEGGRPIDKREFRETTNALDWLSICQMGWFRHEPIGYKHDLLDKFGDDFTRQGLPVPSGIVMKVSDDGTKWYAWRRTIGRHYFAIGASGAPPTQWRYDGPNPPKGFPGIAPEWGQLPFDYEASTNWYEYQEHAR